MEIPVNHTHPVAGGGGGGGGGAGGPSGFSSCAYVPGLVVWIAGLTVHGLRED